MSEITVLAEGLGSPEGPDFLVDGRAIFVETFKCRVSAWSPDRGVQLYADTAGAPNACLRGLDGVYVTQTGATAGPWRSPRPTTPSIQKIDAAGNVETLVSSASGQPLIGPNDLSFGPDGRLYFTDPGLFDPDAAEDGRICVVEPDGSASILEEVGPVYPNGIVAEPDGGIVWTESFSRRVRRRHPGGSIELLATLPDDRILDGFKVAEDGNFYVTGVTSGGIDVMAPDGELVDFVDLQAQPLNCVFNGTDLYVTDFGNAPEDVEDGGRLLRVPLEVGGRELFRGAIAAGG